MRGKRVGDCGGIWAPRFGRCRRAREISLSKGYDGCDDAQAFSLIELAQK